MKRLFLSLMGAAALTLMLGACSQSKNADAAAQEGESTEATAAADKSEAAAAEAQAPKVVEVANDAAAPNLDKVKKLTIIDFNATWCVPCRKFESVFDSVAENYGDDAFFLSVDVDNCPQLAEKYNVSSIPTILLIRPDGKTETYVGLEDIYPYDKFEQVIKKNL